MKALAPIDFVAPRRPPRVGSAVLLGAAAALAWQGWHFWQDRDVLERQRDTSAAASRQAAAPQRSVTPLEQRQQAQLEQLARHLAAPWGDLLALLEHHGAGDVALERLEPDAAIGTLTLTARARHRAAMLAYVIALEHDARLASVLLAHHEIVPEVSGTSVVFTVQAVWRPARAVRARQETREAAP